MLKQKTLRQQIVLQSVGLHSGRDVSITLMPAAENNGVTFASASKSKKSRPLSAQWGNVVNTVLCTELRGPDGSKYRTIEHLMSAIRACNLDNVEVLCDGNEIPILDGSAAPFIRAIQSVGLIEQQAPRRALKIRKPVRVESDDKWVELLPFDGCRYDMEIDFQNPAIGQQILNFSLSYDAYVSDIASARTFGELNQATGLHAAGLALGAGPSNTLIFDGEHVVSHEGKRFHDECVRHKILDAIGDLHLIGAPIIGHFRGYKSGHKMHALLLEAVVNTSGAFSWVNATADAIDDAFPKPGTAIEPTAIANNPMNTPTDTMNNTPPKSYTFGAGTDGMLPG